MVCEPPAATLPSGTGSLTQPSAVCPVQLSTFALIFSILNESSVASEPKDSRVGVTLTSCEGGGTGGGGFGAGVGAPAFTVTSTRMVTIPTGERSVMVDRYVPGVRPDRFTWAVTEPLDFADTCPA